MSDFPVRHFVRYGRQATAVLAQAGLRSATICAGRALLARSTICRATDSERQALPGAARSIAAEGERAFPYPIIIWSLSIKYLK